MEDKRKFKVCQVHPLLLFLLQGTAIRTDCIKTKRFLFAFVKDRPDVLEENYHRG